jgi:integrase
MAVYRDERDGKWRYRKTITLTNGRKLRISGTPPISTKVAAEDAERRHIERALTSRQGPTKKEVPRFEAFAQEFLEKYVAVKNKPSEIGTKHSIFRHHLVPRFGTKKLDEIDAEAIAGYTSAALKAKKSPKTINNHLTVLRRTLAIAVKWGRLDRVPEIDWLKAPKPPFDFLDFAEAARLIDAGEGEWRTVILLALKTGLRQGELLALRWEDVDLVAGKIRIAHSVTRGVVTTPKSGKPREVPLSDAAVRALRAHRHLRGELVFCDGAGKMLTKGACKCPLLRACKRASLRQVGWHALRHTFASHLVMRNVPLKAVQELLGHATIEMTMRYAHLSPDARRDAVSVLDLPAPDRTPSSDRPANRLTTAPAGSASS